MIGRDIAAATTREFDLVIIGGGIHGVCLLQQAARRGLSACLCEADDFGGGTSWNTLRILHGGVRHLQSLSLARFFQSAAARRRMAELFPTLVRPLECLMPLYGQGLKHPFVMRLGLMTSNLLDRRRNSGLAEVIRLPAGRVLDVAATRRAFPLARTEGLQGAACWSDYRMVSSERILMELLRDACRHRALAFNYVRVLELVVEGGVARGVRLRDRLTAKLHTIAARLVVNCTGPRLRELARGRGGDVERLFRPSLAFNLLLDLELPGNQALAVAAPRPSAPVLFLVPQQGSVLAGTLHLPRDGDTVEAKPTEREIEHFLDLLNAAVPGLGARRDRVRRIFAGLLPAAAPGSADLARREVLTDHGAAGGVHGLYSVSGVKFTTAGDVARRTLALLGVGRRGDAPCELPLSTATDLLTNARHCWGRDDATLGADLSRVVQEESVQCIDDLILRRSNWATTELDLDRLRHRVARFVNVPAVIA